MNIHHVHIVVPINLIRLETSLRTFRVSLALFLQGFFRITFLWHVISSQDISY